MIHLQKEATVPKKRSTSSRTKKTKSTSTAKTRVEKNADVEDTKQAASEPVKQTESTAGSKKTTSTTASNKKAVAAASSPTKKTVAPEPVEKAVALAKQPEHALRADNNGEDDFDHGVREPTAASMREPEAANMREPMAAPRHAYAVNVKHMPEDKATDASMEAAVMEQAAPEAAPAQSLAPEPGEPGLDRDDLVPESIAPPIPAAELKEPVVETPEDPPAQEQQQTLAEPDQHEEQHHEEPRQQHEEEQHHEKQHHYRIPAMYICMITPEVAPVAKVGGLADVVFGLACEVELRGNTCEIILPKYDCMRYDHIYGLTICYQDLWVPWYGGAIHCSVWFGFVHGRKCFFIEPHSKENFFNRGCFYGCNDDNVRFAFFCRAALEFMLKSGKHPEIIHCHDWQTGLVPVLLFEMYKWLGMTHPRVCYTIHNFKHQGAIGHFVLEATGLNNHGHFLCHERLLDNFNPHAVNMMKGGIVYSNFVTTVSPRHAWEAKCTDQGFGLGGVLHAHHIKYGGVLNGVSYDTWNPEIDSYIPHHYGIDTIEDKYRNKHALRCRLWLQDDVKPIIAFIGRLDPQKGLNLVRHALFHAIHNSAQFILLGSSPDHQINNQFWDLKRQMNDNQDSHLEIGFNNELAHLIYAGADMVFVPSLYEPCGLTQMIGMRYGTVPIVRAVGGLADTVFDKDYSDKPLHERNGYVFHQPNTGDMEHAIHRAIRCYYDYPDHFRHLMLNGMRYDYSWNHPGQHYLNIYDFIREK